MNFEKTGFPLIPNEAAEHIPVGTDRRPVHAYVVMLISEALK